MEDEKKFVPKQVMEWLRIKGIQQSEAWKSLSQNEQQIVLYQMATIFGWKHVIKYCVVQNAVSFIKTND